MQMCVFLLCVFVVPLTTSEAFKAEIVYLHLLNNLLFIFLVFIAKSSTNNTLADSAFIEFTCIFRHVLDYMHLTMNLFCKKE